MHTHINKLTDIINTQTQITLQASYDNQANIQRYSTHAIFMWNTFWYCLKRKCEMPHLKPPLVSFIRSKKVYNFTLEKKLTNPCQIACKSTIMNILKLVISTTSYDLITGLLMIRIYRHPMLKVSWLRRR